MLTIIVTALIGISGDEDDDKDDADADSVARLRLRQRQRQPTFDEIRVRLGEVPVHPRVLALQALAKAHEPVQRRVFLSLHCTCKGNRKTGSSDNLLDELGAKRYRNIVSHSADPN